MLNNKDFAAKLISLVGGKENIINVFNCYTRARTNVKDLSKVNTELIKTTEGVIGLVVDKNQVQIIIGPGKAVKVAQEMNDQLGGVINSNTPKEEIKDDVPSYLKTKEEVRKKTGNAFTNGLRKLSGVFVPIIPMFIACGLLFAIFSMCNEHIRYYGYFETTTFGKIFKAISTCVFGVLNIVVGYNATKEFGGDGIIGAALAGAFSLASGIGEVNLGFYVFKGEQVGIITILLMSIGIAHFEKLLRKFMPDVIDAFATPFITVIVISAVTLFVLQPIGGLINQGFEIAFKWISENCPYVLGIVPAFYLLMVLTGTHHAFNQINTVLVQKTGITPLLPVQLMAGFGQLGAAIYIALKTKNKQLKKTIISSMPIGALGIDEPLIWGMSVPLKSPFIAGGIGAFFGGTFVACMGLTSRIPESIGVQAAFVITKPWFYLLGFVISVIGGFIFQALIGFKDTFNDETGKEVKQEYSETSYGLKLYNIYREKHPKKIKQGAK